MTRSVLALGVLGFWISGCGDSGTGTGGSPSTGGSPPTGGAGGEAPLECNSTPRSAPYWCECVDAYWLTMCAADECDGETACEEACAEDGGVVSFAVADYLPGDACDSVCDRVCNCPNASTCDVYFWCDIVPGQAQAEAEAELSCAAESGGNWSCDANGLPTYDGPTTCD